MRSRDAEKQMPYPPWIVQREFDTASKKKYVLKTELTVVLTCAKIQ